MLEFIIFILSTLGATFIVVFFYVFKWFRNIMVKISPNFLGKLFSCPACVGFWNGLIIRYIQTINSPISIDIVLYGFMGSFICYISYLFLKPLMDKYD